MDTTTGIKALSEALETLDQPCVFVHAHNLADRASALAVAAWGATVVVIDTSGGRQLATVDTREETHLSDQVAVELGDASALVRDVHAVESGGNWQTLATCFDVVVAAATGVGRGRVVVVGATGLFDPRLLVNRGVAGWWADTLCVDQDELATLLSWWIQEPDAATAGAVVVHWQGAKISAAVGPQGDEAAALAAARQAAGRLPGDVWDALGALADGDSPPAVLVKDVPWAEPGATPASPEEGRWDEAEVAALAISRSVGHPVGYVGELGGRLVQHLCPTADDTSKQTSTSSAVVLEMHTETAHHPDRPRWLVLGCLRGDDQASTLLVDVATAARRLPLAQRATLFEERFRMGVDKSFGGGDGKLGAPHALLTGDFDEPVARVDVDLGAGVDLEADIALDALSDALMTSAASMVLDAHDVVVIDNHRCVHGRGAFQARFDGTDRWLVRVLCVSDLTVRTAPHDGRCSTLRFAGDEAVDVTSQS
jgi:L-asparagine oxygenase